MWMQMMEMAEAKGWGKDKCGGKGGGKGKGKGRSSQKKEKNCGRGPDIYSTLPQGEDAPFKARLNQAIQQQYRGEVFPKGYITYTTEGGMGSYMCEVTCEKFATSYSTEAQAVTKRQAEENAAMHAMKAEFEEAYNSVPQKIKDLAEDITTKREPGGQKRSLGELVNSETEDGKSKLNIGITILIGRSLTKGEIEYTEEEKDNSVEGTVTINCLDGEPQVFIGEPAEGLTNAAKKEAQNNAAEVALAAFKDDIDIAIPVYEAKKAAAAEERGAARHEQRMAKKAAEAEAAGEEPPEKKAKVDA